MALKVVYRSYGGENRKARPEYYSKLLALTSLLRAAEGTGAEVVFMNDGPIPEDRLRLMRDAGEVVQLPGVGMRGSYMAGLRYATSGRWDDMDLLWYSEDDYLYRPDALRHLQRAGEVIPEAEYLTLVGVPWSSPARPAGWRQLPPWDVDGQEWVRIYSTTSTFGARIGALAEDLPIFRLCMLPHKNQYRDHDICLVYQGFEPYRYGDLARSAVGLGDGDARARLRGAVLAPFLLATNLRSHRRPQRRRLLLAPVPNLAAHMETDMLTPGVDWTALAEETRTWGLDNHLMGSTPEPTR